MTTSTFSGPCKPISPACRRPISTCSCAGVWSFGPVNQTVLITESLLDSRTRFYGCGDTETIYTIGWLDTKDGPLVIEMPPHVLGLINDCWARYVTDLGTVGPDR